MGCSSSSTVGQSVLVIYSSDVGWSQLAADVCQQVLKVDKHAVIDCRAAGSVTGEIQLFLLKKGKKQLVFSGDKKATQTNMKNIGDMLRKKIQQ